MVLSPNSVIYLCVTLGKLFKPYVCYIKVFYDNSIYTLTKTLSEFADLE